MKKTIITSLTTIVMMAQISCGGGTGQQPAILNESKAPFGAPEFHLYQTADYLEAFKTGIEEKRADIKRIIENSEAPTFENTIDALELSGKSLEKVSSIFFNLNESDNTPEMTDIENAVSPLLTELSGYIFMNDSLFTRIRTLYDNRESLHLSEEQMIVLDNYYQQFVRGGALLNAEDKAKLLDINTKLSLASIEFSKNLLADSKLFKLVITDEKELSGLPESVRDAAAETAKAQGLEGWVFTLDKPSCIPFLQYADNRDLREKIYKAYYGRGDNDNENNNKEVIRRILQLRQQKARLLGGLMFQHLITQILQQLT